MKKNLKKLTAIQRQILQFLFIIDESVLHVFLYFIHFQFQIISMLDELIDVEVLSEENEGDIEGYGWDSGTYSSLTLINCDFNSAILSVSFDTSGSVKIENE